MKSYYLLIIWALSGLSSTLSAADPDLTRAQAVTFAQRRLGEIFPGRPDLNVDFTRALDQNVQAYYSEAEVIRILEGIVISSLDRPEVRGLDSRRGRAPRTNADSEVRLVEEAVPNRPRKVVLQDKNIFEDGPNISSMACSRDGRLIAVGHQCEITLWDAVTGKYIRTLSREDWGKGHNTWSLTFSDCGNYIFSFDNRRILHKWKVESGRCVNAVNLRDHNIRGNFPGTKPFYSKCGRFLACLKASRGDLHIFDVETGLCIKSFNIGSKKGADFGRFSSDGKKIIIAYHGRRVRKGEGDHSIKIWDLETEACVLTLPHTGRICAFDCSTDNRYLASSSATVGDKNIKIWDLLIGECIKTYQVKKIARSLHFSFDAKSLIVGGIEEVSIWDLESDRCIVNLDDLQLSDNSEWRPGTPKTCLLPNGDLAAGNTEKLLIYRSLVPPRALSAQINHLSIQSRREVQECPICMEAVGIEQASHTACCNALICNDDVAQIRQRAQELYQNLGDPVWRRAYGEREDFNGFPDREEHARCPFCRHYPLEMQGDQAEAPQVQECPICYIDQERDQFPALECGHAFCRGCLEHMVDTAIRERSTQDLKCPEEGCAARLSEQDVRAITNGDQIKIDAIALAQAREWLVTQPNAKQCPTPDCPFVFLYDEDEVQTIMCPECDQNYCSSCLHLHDQQMSCRAAEAERNDNPENRRWLLANTKPCPQCHARIEKYAGCLYVRCTRCNHGFCFNCYGTHHVIVCNNPAVNPEDYAAEPVEPEVERGIADMQAAREVARQRRADAADRRRRDPHALALAAVRQARRAAAAQARAAGRRLPDPHAAMLGAERQARREAWAQARADRQAGRRRARRDQAEARRPNLLEIYLEQVGRGVIQLPIGEAYVRAVNGGGI